GREVGAVRGVVASVLALLEGGATHVAVATDHVIRSFRNDLWAGYKDGSDVDPAIAEQFGPLEEALAELGVCVWPMTEFEADDALAAGAALAAADDRVARVLVCTPDKDLAQCVGGVVFQWDRRRDVVYDAAAVRAKFGVGPESIPDYLALVGDSADGFPGLAGWGPKSAAAVLARYGSIDDVPADAARWDVAVRGAARLAETLAAGRELARLFREIATVRTDAPVSAAVDDLRWTGPRDGFAALCEELGSAGTARRATELAAARAGTA
ncbi:MAG TPA: flap endonuclease, partial [Acidimicrobiaceae bacterium]|nr:flap endonuclease [Acidimicrobiaceae bacterium]